MELLQNSAHGIDVELLAFFFEVSRRQGARCSPGAVRDALKNIMDDEAIDCILLSAEHVGAYIEAALVPLREGLCCMHVHSCM
jgi:hypothetical protein